MKVQTIVTRLIERFTPNMHVMRRRALSACISSILNGSSSTVTRIGRGIDGPAYEKHRIKRADRLCTNPNMQLECSGIYSMLTNEFAAISSTPIILVDWSDLDERQEYFLLSASTALDGRGLPIYQEVHCIKTKDKPEAHRQFLTRLKKMLPSGVKPIIVTDAGFRGPWFELVRELGWDFVGRVRNKTQYTRKGEDQWAPIKSLYEKATGTPKLIANVELAKSKPVDLNLVLYKKAPKGRHKYTKKGNVAQWTNSKLASAREKEPWLLATSLHPTSKLAKRVVKIYAARMQIEENFRDLKNQYYGLGFSANRTRVKARLSVLLLLTVLASHALLLIGILAEKNGLQKRYQSNTVTKKRVLSFQFLGMRIYQSCAQSLIFFTWKEVLSEIKLRYDVFEEAAFE